jgi:chromosome segregation protein
LAQKNMTAQNLRERTQQKYHLNLDDIRSECITITYADEGPAMVETLTPEQMAHSGAGTDWDAVAKQVEELQRKLDDLGPVNLVAIEEYEETEQRQSHQHADKGDVPGDVYADSRQLPADVHRSLRRRQSGFDFDG